MFWTLTIPQPPVPGEDQGEVIYPMTSSPRPRQQTAIAGMARPRNPLEAARKPATGSVEARGRDEVGE